MWAIRRAVHDWHFGEEAKFKVLPKLQPLFSGLSIYMDYQTAEIRLRLVDNRPPSRNFDQRTAFALAFSDFLKGVCDDVVSTLGNKLSIKTMDRCEGVISSLDESKQLRDSLCPDYVGNVRFTQHQGTHAFSPEELHEIARVLKQACEQRLGYEIDDAEIVIPVR